ncbi:MAG: YhgE/Pip family protein [Collinsella sp.]
MGTVTSTLVTEAKKFGVDIDAAGESAHVGVMADVAHSVDALDQVRSGLSDMNATIDAAKKAAADAKSALAGMDEEAPSLVEALQRGDALLGTTRSAARDFHTALSSALSNGAMHLGTAASDANSAVGAIAGAASSAKTKIDISLIDFQSVIDANTRAIEALRKINGQLGNSGDIADRDSRARGARTRGCSGSKTACRAKAMPWATTPRLSIRRSGAMNDAIQGSVEGLGKTQKRINEEVMPRLSDGLDAFSSVSGDLVGVVRSLTPTIGQSISMLDQLDAMLDQTRQALASSDKTLADLQTTLGSVATDLSALRSSEATADLATILDMDPEDMSDFMSAPVTLRTEPVYPVANYGSGVTPFYTNLALWVGGFVLIAIFKLEVDDEGLGRFTANQGYFGRWMLHGRCSALSRSIIVCAGDLVLGTQCEHPALFMLAGVFTSFVYVNIIYALAISFKHIGKAIGVILVIVQIPGSSGMYPIEMMPGFFQALHPLLPFTYGINAMRETIGGMYGMDYLMNLVALGVFLLIALFVGVWLRPKLLNLNLLFDRELTGTGVMICEHDDMAREHFSLRSTVRALLDTEAYRRDVVERAARFERRYPTLIKTGFCLVFGLPILLFILTATLDLDIDGKLVMLAAVDRRRDRVPTPYMIFVEYLRQSLRDQVHMSGLPADEMRRELEPHHALRA